MSNNKPGHKESYVFIAYMSKHKERYAFIASKISTFMSQLEWKKITSAVRKAHAFRYNGVPMKVLS